MGVSILVFVELALDVYGYVLPWAVRTVSILVFVELALDVWHDRNLSHSNPGFNPCFRGTCS